MISKGAADKPNKHQKDALSIVQFMRPKPCHVPLLRIGGDRDGAYLVPDDLDGIEACFSPGVNNFKFFEDTLLEEYEISSHMCDFSSNADAFRTPLVEGKQTFQKKWLDVNGSEDSISLAEWTAQLAPGSQDLLLQIDIEGAEYRNIINTDDEVMKRFRVIVIELHGLGELNNETTTAQRLKPFFDKLAKNFICVHAHPNNCTPQVAVRGTPYRVPPIIELTLLSKDRIKGKRKASLITPQLPHPLDIDRNVRPIAPLFLDANWLDGPQSDASRLKQCEDELDFFNKEAIHPATMVKIAREVSWMFQRCAVTPPVTKARPNGTLTECAAQKPYVLSSRFNRYPITGEVEQKPRFFFHTGIEVGPRITIDLEGQFSLKDITVTNRTDGSFARCDCMIALAHDDPDPQTGFGFPFVLSDDFLGGRERDVKLALGGVKARYVSLVTPLYTALHLSDIKIMGRPV